MLSPLSFKKISFAVSMGFALVSSTALAQNIPPSVDAGRLNNSMQQQTAPRDIATPEDLSTTPEVQAPEGSDQIKLVLKAIDVVGATAVPAGEVEAAYAESLGKQITLTEVYAIANRITRIYRDHGFILSRAVVPEQQIKDGVVTLQIVEGFISDYIIQADDVGARKEIEAFAKKMMNDGPLTAKTLERYLLLMNDLPGITVRSVLSPSKTVAGGADMILIAEQKKFEGGASIDNYGNTYLGPERLMLRGQANSLFGSSDQIYGMAMWAPSHDELRYYSAGIRHNIGSEGTKIGASVSYAETDPTLPLALGGLLDPNGESLNVSFMATHPFIRSRDLNVNGGLTFDITHNTTEYDPAFSVLNTSDDQRVLRANGQMTYLDKYAGYNMANLSASQGLEIAGSSRKGDAGLSRSSGDPAFTKINIDASRLQRIYGALTGLIAVTGQYSFQSLLSSEQFGLGGNDFGRGYDSSEVTGDQGIAAKAELAYSIPLQYQYLNSVQPYAFYDIGSVWTRTPSAGQDKKDSLASTGLGVRTQFIPSVQGDVFVAKPLTADVGSRGEDSKDLRFKFALTGTF